MTSSRVWSSSTPVSKTSPKMNPRRMRHQLRVVVRRTGPAARTGARTSPRMGLTCGDLRALDVVCHGGTVAAARIFRLVTPVNARRTDALPPLAHRDNRSLYSGGGVRPAPASPGPPTLARISSKPSRMHSISTSGSGTAPVSMLMPTKQVPQYDIRVTFSAARYQRRAEGEKAVDPCSSEIERNGDARNVAGEEVNVLEHSADVRPWEEVQRARQDVGERQ